MLTAMSEDDWAIVLQVFQAVRSRRGDRGGTTGSLWKRCIILRFTTSPGGRFRRSSATGTRSGSGSGG